MAVDNLDEDVGEVGVRVEAAELAGLDQRSDDRPVLAAVLGASEQRIFAIEGDRADCSFDRVGVDLDAAVVEEAGQTLPARERVADRLPPPWAYAGCVRSKYSDRTFSFGHSLAAYPKLCYDVCSMIAVINDFCATTAAPIRLGAGGYM